MVMLRESMLFQCLLSLLRDLSLSSTSSPATGSKMQIWFFLFPIWNYRLLILTLHFSPASPPSPLSITIQLYWLLPVTTQSELIGPQGFCLSCLFGASLKVRWLNIYSQQATAIFPWDLELCHFPPRCLHWLPSTSNYHYWDELHLGPSSLLPFL